MHAMHYIIVTTKFERTVQLIAQCIRLQLEFIRRHGPCYCWTSLYCTKHILSQISWALDGSSYPKQLWSLRYYMWPKMDMGKICPAWLGNVCSKALLRNQFKQPNFYFCWFFKKYKNNQRYDMPKLTLWYQATKSWILGCLAIAS